MRHPRIDVPLMDFTACYGNKQTYREGEPPLFRLLLLGISKRAREHIVQLRHRRPRERIGVAEREEMFDCWREVGDHGAS